MDQRIIFLIFLLSIANGFDSATAQYNLGFSEEADGIVFDRNGSTTRFGAAGGFNTPQFSEIDLNGDGELDLFAFDRNNDVVRTFTYNPTTQEYDYSPEFESLFPNDLKEFALLRDYNCDGHADIFTYYLAGFRVYQNQGTTPPSFVKVTDKIKSDYGSITTGAFVLAGDIPAIDDIDGDGDLDILAFGTVNSENSIEYHRNVSQDLYNSCDSLEFEVVTQCWGNIEEPANSATLVEANCKGIVPPPGRESIHPGSSILVFDAQADGDQDLVVGDIQTDRAVFAINAGDASMATIDVNQQTTDFPNATDPVRMQYLVSGFKVDPNHDGNVDLIMTVNNTIDSSVNTGHVWLYHNTSSGAPSFALETKTFLIGEMLDLGANISVVDHDVDGDGDIDLLMSNDYQRTPTGNTRSRIYYFSQQNDGSFLLVDQDFAGISAFGFDAADIALGDMDDDGDDDMILGDQDGNLHYFKNDPSGGMMSLSLSQPIYQGINTIGSNASPEIADVNGDGLLDLLVGERIGTVSYFENTGSATSASFTSSPTIANFGGIDVSGSCCVGHARPRWINNPALANGKYLMVGSDEKRVDIYAVPEDLTSSFTLADSLSFHAGRLAPRFVDLNGDGVFEMICGTSEGGVKYYTRPENILIGLKSPSVQLTPLTLFPNPTSSALIVQGLIPGQGQITITGLDGRPLQSINTSGQTQMELDLKAWSEGYYLLHYRTENATQSERFLILH